MLTVEEKMHLSMTCLVYWPNIRKIGSDIDSKKIKEWSKRSKVELFVKKFN